MTTLSQRIAALNTERGAMVRAYESAVQPALTENRDLNEVETATIGECRTRLETIDQQLVVWTQAETALASAAQPSPGGVPGNRPGTALTLQTQRANPVIQMARRDAYKGADFVRMAIAISVAGFWNAAEYARMRWGDDMLCECIQRAIAVQFRAPVAPMASNEVVGGSDLITRFEYLASEFIEMLRPMLIVGRMPSMRRLSFNNNGLLMIPRQTGGVAGGYVGEGGAIVVNRLTFGQMTLTPSKLAVIVPQTQELLRRSDPPTEMLIRDDMLEGTARTIDRFWFSLIAAAANPSGILFGVPENVPGRLLAVVPPAQGVTEATESLKAMILSLRMQNVPMNAPVWIMNARTKEYLRLLRTVQEIFAFKAEIDAGTLLGYPIIDSTAIAIPFPPGTGTQTAYALVDASQLIWADDMMPIIDASQEASIEMNDAPQQPPNPGNTPNIYSAFQNDMVLMRLRMSHSWARRHDVAVTWALSEV